MRKTSYDGHRQREGSRCGCAACGQTMLMFKICGMCYLGFLTMFGLAVLFSRVCRKKHIAQNDEDFR